jgi:hypothetical protein
VYFALDRAGTAHDGNLYSMSLSGGVPQRGTKRLVSGPDAGDHLHWKSRGLFVYSP